jgi:hypothetical protein
LIFLPGDFAFPSIAMPHTGQGFGKAWRDRVSLIWTSQCALRIFSMIYVKRASMGSGWQPDWRPKPRRGATDRTERTKRHNFCHTLAESAVSQRFGGGRDDYRK